jgi:hypothetical protein
VTGRPISSGIGIPMADLALVPEREDDGGILGQIQA